MRFFNIARPDGDLKYSSSSRRFHPVFDGYVCLKYQRRLIFCSFNLAGIVLIQAATDVIRGTNIKFPVYSTL